MYDESGNAYGFVYHDGQKQSTNSYYYVKNLQGDVVAILNSNNTVVAEYVYDAYGNILSVTDGNGNAITYSADHIANINPIRYRGYYYDTETMFYYLQSRYYDPYLGRFINADNFMSTGQGGVGYNMYVYCNNMPIMLIDFSGRCPYDGTAADFRRLEMNLPPIKCDCEGLNGAKPPAEIFNPAKEFGIVEDDDDYKYMGSATYSKDFTQDEVDSICGTRNILITIDGLIDTVLSFGQDAVLKAAGIPSSRILEMIDAYATVISYDLTYMPTGTYNATLILYGNPDGNHILLRKVSGPEGSDYNTEGELDYIYGEVDYTLKEYAFPNSIGVKYP